MDIKIGFTDTPRELVISSAGEQEQLLATLRQALESNQPVVELADEQDRRYLVRSERVAYVEVGTSAPRHVGFAGA